MGTENTSNNLHQTLGGYENITTAFDMAISNWNMMRIVESDVKLENGSGDWMDAIIVAMDFIRGFSETRKYSSLKIVLFTTFAGSVNNENADTVMKGLKGMNIELIVINDNILCEDEDDENNTEVVKAFTQNRQLSPDQKQSENLIENIIEHVSIIILSITDN